jgi:small subunit ribosomal protein S4
LARYTDSVCRLCRNEGEKLYLKGTRCYSVKCAIERRRYGTGQHGQDRKKQSEYAVQLREKNKLRRSFGVLESQFSGYFTQANRQKKVPTGLRLLQFLEQRLDNILFRTGLVTSRAQARQLILHGHFLIDGKKVNVPSYLLKPGQVVSVAEGSKELIAKLIENVPMATQPPAWLLSDREQLKAGIVNLPEREDLDQNIREALIVEFYSR